MAKINSAVSIIKRFIDVDPQQAAIAFEGLPEDEAAALLRTLPIGAAVSCIEHTQPPFSAAVIERLFPEPANAILQRIEPDHAADVFRAFSKESQQVALEGLTEERKKEVSELLGYPEDSAGRLMHTDPLAFHKDLKVKDAIHRLRQFATKKNTSTYSYVIGNDHKLAGVLNMRDLLLAGPDATIEQIMLTDVLSVPAFTDREELVHLARERHFISIPVVDAHGRLIGAIKNEDLLESSEEEATEDLQLMFGASSEERAFSPVKFKVAQRLPWLHVNLVTAFLAGSVVAMFEDLIGRIAVLAVFLPIIAGQGGNAGSQSLAVVLRGLVMREVRPKDAKRLILAEVTAGFLNGLVIAAVTGGVAWAWRGNPYLGLVVGMAMVVNMVAATMAGAAIPILMKRFGYDPAQSSGIFLTTVTDVVGFLSFLGFALIFQDKLI